MVGFSENMGFQVGESLICFGSEFQSMGGTGEVLVINKLVCIDFELNLLAAVDSQ